MIVSSEDIRYALFVLRHSQAWLARQAGLEPTVVSRALRSGPTGNPKRSRTFALLRSSIERAGYDFQTRQLKETTQ